MGGSGAFRILKILSSSVTGKSHKSSTVACPLYGNLIFFLAALINISSLSKERKEQKQRIMKVLASKQDEELKGKSVEELEKMLEELK